MKRNILAIVIMLFAFSVQTAYGQSNTVKKATPVAKNEGKWIHLFNGKNLDGWIPKVTGYKAGENPLNGFRVEDGMIRVDYSKFDQFNGRFGHLFYKQKLSSYILHVEYRLVGELMADAPSYCFRNSGVMIHSQSAESMDILQNWPVSLECQILGSTTNVKQHTACVCTPGTTVYYKDKFTTEHCLTSTSQYYNDGEWVNLDIIVHGNKAVYHVVNGDTVLAYTKPQIGGMLLPEGYPVPEGTYLHDGYIALQAEGQPIDFRKVDLKILPDNFRVAPSKKQIRTKGTAFKMIDNFESYASDEALNAKWVHPHHSATLDIRLDATTKGEGKKSLKCTYRLGINGNTNQCSIYNPGALNLSACNGLQFWMKPDGSGREVTIELNVADKDGNNVHDFWSYTLKPEKGITESRMVSIPFFSFKHNQKHNQHQADSAEAKPVFRSEAVIGVVISIGGKNEQPGGGVYYFDELAGAKLQF